MHVAEGLTYLSYFLRDVVFGKSSLSLNQVKKSALLHVLEDEVNVLLLLETGV